MIQQEDRYQELYPKLAYAFGIISIALSLRPLHIYLYRDTGNIIILYIIPIVIFGSAIIFGYLTLKLDKNNKKGKFGMIVGTLSVIIFIIFLIILS